MLLRISPSVARRVKCPCSWEATMQPKAAVPSCRCPLSRCQPSHHSRCALDQASRVHIPRRHAAAHPPRAKYMILRPGQAASVAEATHRNRFRRWWPNPVILLQRFATSRSPHDTKAGVARHRMHDRPSCAHTHAHPWACFLLPAYSSPPPTFHTRNGNVPMDPCATGRWPNRLVRRGTHGRLPAGHGISCATSALLDCTLQCGIMSDCLSVSMCQRRVCAQT